MKIKVKVVGGVIEVKKGNTILPDVMAELHKEPNRPLMHVKLSKGQVESGGATVTFQAIDWDIAVDVPVDMETIVGNFAS